VTDTNIPQVDDARKTDAPERIWAWVYADPWGNELRWFEWQDHTPGLGDTEYIRADLLAAKDAKIARLREAIGYLIGDMVADDKEDFASVSIALAALQEETP